MKPALGLTMAALFLTACDMTAPAVPAAPDQGVYAFMIMGPAGTAQQMIVETAEAGGRLVDLRSAVYLIADGGGDLVVTGRIVEGQGPASPCQESSGFGGSNGVRGEKVCLQYDFTPAHGATYRVEVAAEGRPTASATVTVPGPLEITKVEAVGSPAGTEGLTVEWTPSEGAFGYLVGIRASSSPRCPDLSGCEDGFLIGTSQTRLTTVVPEWVFENGSGRWYVDVLALSRGLFEFLTTGGGGRLFPVPPVQNVENGYGAIGAWVFDSEPLP